MGRVKEKQAQKRNDILEKILPLLGNIPFETLSMKEICKVADISIGSFYHYFSRKEDLFVGLLNIIDEYMEKEAFPKMKKRNELENIKIFAEEWFKYIETHGMERSKLITASAVTDNTPDGQKRISYTKLLSHVRKGQEKAQIRSDIPAEELTELIMIQIRGLGVDWTRRNGSYSMIERGKEYTDTILKGIKA